MLELRGVSKWFGNLHALKPTDLTLQPGRATALIGPSGCGKSTLLRVMVGLLEPDEGQVLFDGKSIHEHLIEVRRRMGYVIQDGGLFPHLTILENCTLAPIWVRGTPKAEAEATASGKEKREELVALAKRDIEAETRRSLEQIRREVADLTVLATEKVTRKTLSAEDQQRLVEEALAEVDFSSLSGAEKN